MSNRTNLANARAALHDLTSDLRGIELQVGFSPKAQSHIAMARAKMRAAASDLDCALALNLDPAVHKQIRKALA